MRILVGEIALLLTVEVFNMGDVFFFFFGSNINTCYKGVLALSLSLSTTVPSISLVVLVFFLINGRCLLPTGYVSREDVGRFILSGVFILLLDWFIPLETFGINFSDV